VSAIDLDLIMRRATVDDAEFFFRIRNQISSIRFQASPRRSIEEVAALLAEDAETPLTRSATGRFYWTGLVGNVPVVNLQIAVDSRDRSQHAATLGYSVAEEWQGQGIARAAVQRVLPIVFDPTGLSIERLEAVAAVGNIASRRVLEATGFQFEGIQRGLLIIAGNRVDHACYSLLDTDEVIRKLL
jgi:RimJ/RimL family protein N-acetyltransferase